MPAKATWRRSFGALLLSLIPLSSAQRSPRTTVYGNGTTTATQIPVAAPTETLYSFPGTSLSFDPVITAAPGQLWDVPIQYLQIPGIYEAALRVSQVFNTYEPRLSTFCSLRKLAEYSAAQVSTAYWDSNHQEVPCCGNCYVAGQAAELMYWPTPGLSNVTALVDDTGYTFHSPSPYVAFNTLWAENRCSQFGPVISRTTLPVNPTGISRWWVEPTNVVTAPALVRSELLDFRILQGCTQVPGGKQPETITRDDGTVLVLWVADDCNPIIKIPVEVTNAVPEWQTCGVWYSGIYDPPVSLTSGLNLHVPTTLAPDPTPDPTTTSKPVPVPEPILDPTRSTSTPAPTKKPTSSSPPPAGGNNSPPAPDPSPPPAGDNTSPPPQDPSPPPEGDNNSPPPSTSHRPGADHPPNPLPTAQTSVFDIGGTKVTLLPAPTPSNTQQKTGSNGQDEPGPGQILPIGSITLSAGDPAATILGTQVSLGSGVLVIGTQTHSLEPPPTTSHPSMGIGDIILSAMGIDPNTYQASATGSGGVIASFPTGENGSSPTGVNVVPFSGDATSSRKDLATRLSYLSIIMSFAWWL